MFQVLGVFAEFERSMTRERVMAGLARAREDRTKLGRRTLEATDPRKVVAILTSPANGVGVRRTARELGVGVGTVVRLRDGVAAPMDLQ